MNTLMGNVGLIVDLVCLALILAFVITGLIRGFFKRVFKIAVTIGALLIAYFFCDNLVNLLEDQFQLLTKLTDKIVGLDLFKIPADVIKGSLSESIKAAVESMGLPQFIAEAAQSSAASLETSIGNSIEGITLHISTVLSRYILIGASFVALHIVSKLILSVVAIILTKIIELPIINGVDKLLGAIMGLIKGFLVLTVVIYLISVIPGGIFEDLRQMLSTATFGGFLQEHNLFEAIISAVVARF